MNLRDEPQSAFGKSSVQLKEGFAAHEITDAFLAGNRLLIWRKYLKDARLSRFYLAKPKNQAFQLMSAESLQRPKCCPDDCTVNHNVPNFTQASRYHDAKPITTSRLAVLIDQTLRRRSLCFSATFGLSRNNH